MLPISQLNCLADRQNEPRDHPCMSLDIAVLGSVEDEVVACFKRGECVPYENFVRFHSVMAEDSGQSVLSSLESHVLHLVPGLINRLSQGCR